MISTLSFFKILDRFMKFFMELGNFRGLLLLKCHNISRLIQTFPFLLWNDFKICIHAFFFLNIFNDYNFAEKQSISRIIKCLNLSDYQLRDSNTNNKLSWQKVYLEICKKICFYILILENKIIFLFQSWKAI